MDTTEKIVFDDLKYRGYGSVVYEPDGNIPPDFLVEGTIAIEVRRESTPLRRGRWKGVDEVAIPLWNRIKDVVDGHPGGESWFVFFRFTRPVEHWKSLGPKLRQALGAFRASPIKHKGAVAKTQGVDSTFSASKPHATMFVMGGCSDEESGGWLLSKMEANIRFA